ncbi:MAG: peptidylprolyl isomerase [Anaerolineae bacterium]|nr:peptidylprolyl isomerase [Anaerolineae bacterium]
MRKLNLALVLMMALSLAACQDKSQTDDESGLDPIVNQPAATEGIREAKCTVQTLDSTAPTEVSEEEPLFPEVGEGDWSNGPETASVTFTVYSDFQSPFAAHFVPILNQFLEEFPDDVRIVYRHYPLLGEPDNPFHDKASLAVQAVEAAGLQGKFWEMNDLLYEKHAEWSELSAEEFEPWLKEEAKGLELDGGKFAADLVSDELVKIAADAWAFGSNPAGLEGSMRIPGAPYLLINGEPYVGPMDYNNLATVVRLTIMESRQFSECPPMTIDPLKEYTLTIVTEKGDIVIALFPDIAPMAVNSFVFLVEHDWFDNVTFHRVIEGFMAQGGDPSGTGYGGPGYAFEIEPSPLLQFDRAGLLAMANAGPTSNGSQFFITYGPAPHLDGQFTIFGEVIEGMDVVERLTLRDPQGDPNAPAGDLILDMTVEVK